MNKAALSIVQFLYISIPAYLHIVGYRLNGK